MGGVYPVPRCGVRLGAYRAHFRVFWPQENALILGTAAARLLVTCRFQVTYLVLCTQIKRIIIAQLKFGFK